MASSASSTAFRATGQYIFATSVALNSATTSPSKAPDPIAKDLSPTEQEALITRLVWITTAGWITFGVICILCINGQGRAGRWVPEWYLDSKGTKRDRAAVVAWWWAVLLFWPFILPAVVLGKLGRWTGEKLRAKKRERIEKQRKAGHDEEEGSQDVTGQATEVDLPAR